MGSSSLIDPLLIGHDAYHDMPAILNPYAFGDLMDRATMRLESWEPSKWLNVSAAPVANDDPVSDILDVNAIGNNASQSDSGKRGVWKTGQINGHGALLLDGSNDGYTTPLLLSGDYTIYVVSKQASSGGSRMVNSAETNKLISIGRSNNAAYVGSAVAGDLSAYADAWCIGVLRVSSSLGVSSFRVNGVDVTENPSVAADWFTLTIGAVGAVAEAANGYLSALGAFPTSLSLAETQELEAYLSLHTGISI